MCAFQVSLNHASLPTNSSPTGYTDYASVGQYFISGTIIVMFFWAAQRSYQPLMTNLSAEDSASVIRILRERKIPFKVDPSGKNVSIPPEYVYDLRLELATMGVPLKPEDVAVSHRIGKKTEDGTTATAMCSWNL